jgi:hypothetical protein
MTPADEAHFIALWQQGLETAAIAERLGIPRGTVSSRAAALVRQGKIQPRARGGAYPRQQALARQGSSPTVHTTVHDSAVQPPMHGAVSVQNSAEPPIPAPVAVEFARLWAAIDALRQDMHPTVQNTVQSLPEPLFDNPADNTTERWNLYLKRGLRVRLEAVAKARGVAPSRVVQEILWQALTDRR